MRVRQKIAKKPADLYAKSAELSAEQPDFLIVFGSVEHFSAPDFVTTLRSTLPNTALIGCSTAGEISPFTPGASCKLHNQTMTISCLGEA